MASIVRGKINRGDLALWDGKTATSTRVDSTGGTITGLAVNDFVDVLSVFGDGTSRTVGSIEAAARHLGSTSATFKYAPGTWTIDDDLTVAANISHYVSAGAVFNISSGKTLNFLGPVFRESDTYKTGSGTMTNVGGLLGGGTFYATSAKETAAGVTPTDFTKIWGDVLRFDAKIDGSTDDTTAFNNAVNSGHPAFCDATGTAVINGTIVVSTGKSLTLNSGLALKRISGASTAPILHVYGNQTHVDGKGAEIRQQLYDHPKGIVLFGPDPAETSGGTTDVQMYNAYLAGLFIIGPENNVATELESGSAGLVCESLRRRGSSFSNNPSYKNRIENIRIVNCDIGIELRTDFNSNYFTDIYIHQWITAAVYFNAAYGNIFDGLLMESPLDNVTPSATRRYAIHFGEQNGSVNETTTADTSGYGIDGASQNVINCYSELPNTANQILSVYTWVTPASGSVYGNNQVNHTGNTGGGIATGGASTNTAIGPNVASTYSAHLDNSKSVRLRDMKFRGLDDATGSWMGRDSWAVLAGRKANIAESTQEDLFEIDNIPGANAGALIKIMYAGRASAVSTTQLGEITYGVWIEGTGPGVYMYRKMSDTSTSFDEARVLELNCTVAAGTDADSMKATIGFLTSDPAGENEFYLSWKAEVLFTNLDQSGTLDIDADISYL